MKICIIAISLVTCGIVVAGNPRDLDIQGDVLLRWPRDSVGVAVIPSWIRHIGFEAFSDCDDLIAVVLPESLETIGSLAFSGCDRLGEVEIPASVTNIGRSAFFYCRSMTNVVVFAKIKKIPDNMCSLCYRLNHVKFPEDLVEVGDMAFRGCRSLQNIDIPSSTRRIGRGAFVGCSRLTDVELPKGMEIVDEFAFYGCYDLRHLVLHSVPMKIGDGAFRDCSSLKGYVLSGTSGANESYFVSSNREISVENICEDEMHLGSYETVEDALRAIDNICKTKSDKGMFAGLEQVLRIAVDVLSADMHETNPTLKLDSFAAHLFELNMNDDMQAVKRFFKKHSSTSIDAGDKIIAYFCIADDIAIMAEFEDEKLSTLVLSEGLKDAARNRLEVEEEKWDEGVLRWLK